MAGKEYTLDEFEQELKNFVTGCGVKITNTNTEEVNQLFRNEAIVLRRIWRNEERECNIMNYEKEYKEALERAREYHKVDKDNTLKLYAKGTMEYIFPELKESEDEKIRKGIISNLDNMIAYIEDSECSPKEKKFIINDIKKQKTWLEKQGEQKPAWSEEDMRMIDLLVAIFDVNYPDGCYKATPLDSLNVVYKRSPEIIDWLKSLKKRVHWKPSEEQILALDGVYKTHGANGVCRRIIFNLLEQLKKL